MAQSIGDYLVNIKTNFDSANMGDAINKTGLLNGSVISLAKSVIGPMGLAAAFGAAAKAVYNLIDSSLKLADNLEAAREKTGLTAEYIQYLKFVAEQSGGSVDGLAMATKTMTKAAYEASKGSKEFAGIFKDLGVSVKDSNGSLRQTSELFPEMLLKLAEMEDRTTRDALAQKLLGRSFTELRPILNQGKEGIEKLTAELKNTGAVMNDEMVNKWDDLGDSLKVLGKRAEGAGRVIADTLLPPLEKALRDITEFGNWQAMMESQSKKAERGEAFKPNVKFKVPTSVTEAVGNLNEFLVNRGQAGVLSAPEESDEARELRLKREKEEKEKRLKALKEAAEKRLRAENEAEEKRYKKQQENGEKQSWLETHRQKKIEDAAARELKLQSDIISEKAAIANETFAKEELAYQEHFQKMQEIAMRYANEKYKLEMQELEDDQARADARRIGLENQAKEAADAQKKILDSEKGRVNDIASLAIQVGDQLASVSDLLFDPDLTAAEKWSKLLTGIAESLGKFVLEFGIKMAALAAIAYATSALTGIPPKAVMQAGMSMMFPQVGQFSQMASGAAQVASGGAFGGGGASYVVQNVQGNVVTEGQLYSAAQRSAAYRNNRMIAYPMGA